MGQIFSDFCNFCFATIRTLKLGDRVLSLLYSSLVLSKQKTLPGINSDIVGIGSFAFGKSFEEILGLFLYTRQCNLVLLGVITNVPMHFLVFPVEMTCYRGIRPSVVKSSVQTCKLVMRLHTTAPPKNMYDWPLFHEFPLWRKCVLDTFCCI